jgi:hypothetical protein
MRKLFMACLFALPLAVIPSQAWAGHHDECSTGDCEDGGHSWLHGGHLASLHGHFAGLQGHFAGLHGRLAGLFAGHDHAPAVPQAGPWYLYWPYEAHFQTPAPVPYPYYAPAMTLPPSFPGGPPPHQPVGYAPEAAPGNFPAH